jgi:hypothetical protein
VVSRLLSSEHSKMLSEKRDSSVLMEWQESETFSPQCAFSASQIDLRRGHQWSRLQWLMEADRAAGSIR